MNNLVLSLCVTVIISTIVVVGGSIWGFIKGNGKRKMVFISLCAILIAILSWVLNAGWVRVIMTVMLIPFAHAMIFFAFNLSVASGTVEFKSLKATNLLFIITYLIFYIFLPDGADYGEAYFFFGLIHSNSLSEIAELISVLALLLHIVLFIIQIEEVIRLRRKKKLNSENYPFEVIERGKE